jgi:2-polyprenyl-6-hydroxyphenyl methylase/3-demethylubiquinone-9 3-methyltransferase
MGEFPMNGEGKQYPKDHWLLSDDPEKVLEAYLDQQSKVYSQVKNAFIRELLGDLKGKRFLDYGCGAGFFSVHAARAGAAEVVGVDALESALSAASMFARNEGVHNICNFVKSSQFPLGSQRRRFDVILIKDVIEHVENDQVILEAVSQATVPGGTLVLSTQNRLSLNFLIQGTYHRNFLKDKNWFGWDETHLRFYTPMSLNNKLKKAGFSIVAWRSVYLIPHKLPTLPSSRKKFLRLDTLSWIDRILGGVFPYNRLGWNVIVKAMASTAVSQKIPVSPVISKQVAVTPLFVARESVPLEQQASTARPC